MLGRERGGISGQCDHVLDAEIFNNWFHEFTVRAVARPGLEVEKLPERIRRRTGRDPGRHGSPFEVGTMTGGALDAEIAARCL